MNHLSEALLNEYLDGALTPSKRSKVEDHLASCLQCRSEMDALMGVEHTLAGLQEIPLPRDLTRPVLRKLQRKTASFTWKLALITQSGIAIGLMIYLATHGANRWDVHFQDIINSLTASVTLFHGIMLPLHSMPRINLFIPGTLHMPAQILVNNLSIWLILGVAAALLFLIGNLSLIRRNGQKI